MKLAHPNITDLTVEVPDEDSEAWTEQGWLAEPKPENPEPSPATGEATPTRRK